MRARVEKVDVLGWNKSLMSTVDTTENDLSNVDSEIRHEKSIYIFSKLIIKILFFFDAMYNRVNRAQN